MHVILLSGGSGKRLWPLSNDIRSKQFIPVFRDEKGEPQSMAQRVCAQVCRANPEASITVATSKSQVSILRNQLGDFVSLCVEPCRRDTFPAIALASSYLHDVKGLPLEEAVAVCPVDPYVEDGYFLAVRHLTELAASGEKNLMLMGIEPTYPSAKYGYILPKDTAEISGVAAFREKPDEATAARYIEQGALWNSGVFAYRLGYVLERAQELLRYSRYEELLEHYESLEKISFDYAVAERESRIGVLRYAGEWKDLGTWNTLTDIMEEPALGNVTMDDTSMNTHVVNELELPILVMGARDLIVAASPEGVLVADKVASSRMKPYVEQIHQPIMFAEKSWGDFRILDVEEDSLTIKVTLNAGHVMSYHSHERRREVWNILSGKGAVMLDGKRRTVKAGDVLEIPIGMRHAIRAQTDMTLIEVQLGRDIASDDKRKWELGNR